MPKSMLHTHYKPERYVSSLIIGLGTLGLSGLIIWKQIPNWWSEILVMGGVGLGSGLVFNWVWGYKKWGLLSGLLIMGVLVMRRFSILDGISLGLWIAILGLISLVN